MRPKTELRGIAFLVSANSAGCLRLDVLRLGVGMGLVSSNVSVIGLGILMELKWE